MRDKVNIDIETIKIIYSKYKNHLIYITILVVCFILLLKFILPSVLELGNLNKKKEEEIKKLEILKGNMKVLSSLSDSDLDSELKVLVSALPETKDFDGILTAISDASGRSGVPLGDYQFQVGKLSEKIERTKGYPFLKLVLNLRTNLVGTQKFLGELSETLPLSEISDVVQRSDSVTVTTLFYYKPISPFPETEKLTDLSWEQQNLISKISQWRGPEVNLSEVSIPSSPSASSPF